MNLLAARKAHRSAAYQPAFAYAQIGCALLAKDAWQQQYDLALGLYTEAAGGPTALQKNPLFAGHGTGGVAARAVAGEQ